MSQWISSPDLGTSVRCRQAWDPITAAGDSVQVVPADRLVRRPCSPARGDIPSRAQQTQRSFFLTPMGRIFKAFTPVFKRLLFFIRGKTPDHFTNNVIVYLKSSSALNVFRLFLFCNNILFFPFKKPFKKRGNPLKTGRMAYELQTLELSRAIAGNQL